MRVQAGGKPFVKWVGGKGQLLPTLRDMLPEGLAAGRAYTYVEPFVGGRGYALLPAAAVPEYRACGD